MEERRNRSFAESCHRGLPETVCEELFMEKQQRQEKNNRKGGHITGNGAQYPLIKINFAGP